MSTDMQYIPKGFDAATAGNNDDIEKQFAVICMEHAEVYWNLLLSVGPKKIKLTKVDDALLASFHEHFPEFKDTAKIASVKDDDLKTPAEKTKWRAFMKEWEKTIEDYNFGTLLRSDCRQGYSEENSIFVLRIQWIVFELLRCREGLNDHVYENRETLKNA